MTPIEFLIALQNSGLPITNEVFDTVEQIFQVCIAL